MRSGWNGDSSGRHDCGDIEVKPGEKPTYSPGIREVMYLPLVWDV